jgi:hypothetical protein
LLGWSASQAEPVAQICSCPQTGQSMRALVSGSLRNTLGSTSMAVETGSPVIGHLIIMQLMATISPETSQRETKWNFEPAWNTGIVSAVRRTAPC